MGQLALGLRSLLVKAAVFFVLAALLAWALGGTLFPRAECVDREGVEFGGRTWFLRLSVGGDQPGIARYEVMTRVDDDARPERALGELDDAAGLVVSGESLFAGVRTLPADGREWQMVQFAPDGSFDRRPLPDRLAVEEELARLRRGEAPAEGP